MAQASDKLSDLHLHQAASNAVPVYPIHPVGGHYTGPGVVRPVFIISRNETKIAVLIDGCHLRVYAKPKSPEFLAHSDFPAQHRLAGLKCDRQPAKP